MSCGAVLEESTITSELTFVEGADVCGDVVVVFVLLCYFIIMFVIVVVAMQFECHDP